MANEILNRGMDSFHTTKTAKDQMISNHSDMECAGMQSDAARPSPGLESNPDSCYDSDGSSVGSQCIGLHVGEHSDVSRTTSDTLAAERLDTDAPKSATSNTVMLKGTLQTSTPPASPAASCLQPVQKGHQHSGDLMSNVEYATKVEFGLRLGYSEEQILCALSKIGYKVSEDELLSELIQISNMTQDSDDDSEDLTNGLNSKMDQVTLDNHDHDPEELRPIVIDGSNVAKSHGNNAVFSCAGIKLAVDWFRDRGHKEITVFIPVWRKEASCSITPITDQDILLELEKEKIVVFTPARRVAGKRVICNDDLYVIKLAAENDGIVVSNDNYRDLIDKSPDYKKVIEERLLMYSFVNDRFMPPDDPLGRYGPSLNDFLHKYPRGSKTLPKACPYGKKCTYGNKCKYYHPERGQQPIKLVNEKLIEKACKKIKEVKEKGHLGSGEKKTKQAGDKLVEKTPLTHTKSQVPATQKKVLTRTRSLQPGQSISQSKSKALLDTVKPKSHDTECNKEAKAVAAQVTMVTELIGEGSQVHDDKLTNSHLEGQAADSSEETWPAIKEASVMQGTDHTWSAMKEKKQLSSWAVPSKSLLSEFSPSQALFTNGHLALAKKLSDEGKPSSNHATVPTESKMSPHKAQSIAVKQQCGHDQGQKARGHKALQRELSLKGSDDPRLSHFRSVHGVHFAQMEKNQQNLASPLYNQPHWSQQSHALLAKHASCPLTTVQSRESSPRPAGLRGHQQQASSRDQYSHIHEEGGIATVGKNTLTPQHPMSDHIPIHRLKSDPLIPLNSAHTYRLMTPSSAFYRQNSSSDPQLCRHTEQQNWCHSSGGHPSGNTHDQLLENVLQTVCSVTPHLKTDEASPHSSSSVHYGQKSLQVRHSAAAAQLSQTHNSVLHGHNSANLAQMPQCTAAGLQSSSAGVQSQVPVSYQLADFSSPILNTDSGFTSTQSESPSVIIPTLVQDLSKPPSNITSVVGPHSQLPVYQPSVPQNSICQPSDQVHGTVQQHTAICGKLQPSLFVQELPTEQAIPFDDLSWNDAAGMLQQRMSCPSSQSLNETESRRKLYYHLCALFKEEEVQKVMTEHPNETNPQVLCKYLISA